jgi:hypothetical protein
LLAPSWNSTMKAFPTRRRRRHGHR